MVPIQEFIETFGVEKVREEIMALMKQRSLDYFMICTSYAVSETEFQKDLFLYSQDKEEPVIQAIEKDEEYQLREP